MGRRPKDRKVRGRSFSMRVRDDLVRWLDDVAFEKSSPGHIVSRTDVVITAILRYRKAKQHDPSI